MSSVFTQTLYGQPSYSGPSFPAPLPPPPMMPSGYPQYQYQYHQPPAPVFLDPIAFRREFASRLSQLTVNSRPIIQELSLLAQDYSRYADTVAELIEGHIRRVPSWAKLPAFYLLDAISKNFFEPYARIFAPFVVSLFLQTYSQVDEPTRAKMEEMVLTWRTGSPSRFELFGAQHQLSIEQGIWGDGGSGHSNGSQITRAQVLSELQFALGQKERAYQANPFDPNAQNHIAILQQLRKLVETGVSQTELQQILNQLRSLIRSTVPPPPPAPVVPPPSLQWQNQSFAGPSRPTPPIAPYQTNQPHPSGSNIKTESLPAMLPPSVPALQDINKLLSLVKAGVVSSSSTPNNSTPRGAGASHEKRSPTPETIDLSREGKRQYRTAILAQKVKLTSSDILRTRPRIVDFLYHRLTSQCKQCGVRFSGTPAGKKEMNDHLDMHFRQNRKADQNIGRGHSRSWFTGIEDWIHDSSDMKGKGRADGLRLNAEAAANAENAKRDAELRAQYVVVPSGDEAKPISCPICKETLKSEFLEDDEDWVWKNAVMKDERVYHATCHAEALTSTNTLAARLRTEIANASRGTTPELSSSGPIRSTTSKSPPLSPLKLGGTKRKADDSESNVEDEATGTPPLKKLALSMAAS